MEELKFLDEFDRALFFFNRIPDIRDYYNQTKDLLQDFKVIDFLYSSSLEESRMNGTIRIVFFDETLIHELTGTEESFIHNSYQIRHINSVTINIQNSRKFGEQKSSNTIDILKLEISFLNQAQSNLTLSSDTTRVADFLRFKSNLTRQLYI
jgi:hypothetical protein